MDITIAVAMHKQYARTEDTMYLPVHVGADLHPEVLTDIAGDNTGDNISQLNPYFSELTAMYWLWKNNDSDYKGIVHYRRYFASPSLRKRLSRNRFDRILSRQELEPLLANNNVILPSKRRYFIETIYSHYEHTHYVEQLRQTRNILKDMAPEYVDAWDTLMKQRSAHIFNMAIMNKENFNAYCMYWLWKNNDSDYKGIVHYRRYFASPSLRKRLSRNRFDRILSRQELEPLLANNNVILPSKRRYFIETIYSHYEHTHYVEQLRQTRNILKDMAPEYVDAWDTLMKQRSAHIFNMAIMNKENFNAYCEWLFPVLFEVTRRIDPVQYSAFHARYPGRISELLLNVWINANHISYKTVPTIYTEPMNWWNKGTSFLKAKFFKKKYDTSF